VEPGASARFGWHTFPLMATKEQCEAALAELTHRLEQVDELTRRRHALDRTVECRVSDLAVTFSGRLVDGQLFGLTEGALVRPQVRFTLVSDDLLAVTAGELAVGAAWASGRLRVEAAVLDLLRLRSLI